MGMEILTIVITILMCILLFMSPPERTTEVDRIQTVFGSGFDLTSCDQLTERDVFDLCLRIRERDVEEFEAVALVNKFHQHIGPNNIYGVKMALYAKKLLDGKDHQITVLSEAGTRPPISCLNDGIMTAIAATFGRGLIHNVPDLGRLAATFSYEGRSVRLEVKPEKLAVTQKFISDARKKYGGLTEDYFRDVRKMGLFVWENYTQEELFIVTYPPTDEEELCSWTEMNISAYLNRLHDFLHASPTSEEILGFIEKDVCVSNGAITERGLQMEISAVWKADNRTISFMH